MIITALRVAGDGSRRPLAADDLARRSSVLVGGAGSGKTTIAELVAQLIYGKTAARRALRPGEPAPLVEGSITVKTPQGGYVLRRHRDGSPHGRLTVAAQRGGPVDGRAIQQLLGSAPPELLAKLYAVDFAATPRVEELFAPEFARQFNTVLQSAGDDPTSGPALHENQTAEAIGSLSGVDANTDDLPRRSRQLETLVARRDELAGQLEDYLADRRRQNGGLQRKVAELEASLESLRQQRASLVTESRRLQAQRASVAVQLRYFTLEAAARRTTPGEHDKLQAEIDGLDGEIGRCRQTLGDLQQRDAVVRREIAAAQSDGAAGDVDSLADQRATLGVIERLLDDLDAETAQLARAVETDSPPPADAHARFTPVADMLRQQAYALCGQITEQERAVRRRQFQIEARQLARAQSDLSDQLEHLLAQRQAAVHRLRLEAQPAVVHPHVPAEGHCRCTDHRRFVVESDAMVLGRGDRARGLEEARRSAADLDAQIEQITDQIAGLDRQLADGRQRWNAWQRNRTGLLGTDAAAGLKTELDSLEVQISHLLSRESDRPAAVSADGWRASDILAQLTDGRLVQLGAPRGTAAGEVIDCQGRRRNLDELTPGERDQAYLAVTLALVASHGGAGARLPLVLDDPFQRQTPADAAAMAGVLASFAAEGRQVLVFTSNQDAVRRFTSLGTALYQLDRLRDQATAAETPAPQTPVADQAVTTRVVRETVALDGPQLRLAGTSTPANADCAVYYLTAEAGMGDFPVLGADTADRFANFEIHTCGDLLQADPQHLANGLGDPRVSAAVVALWQTHMRLMCFVAGVSLNDAQLLAACGIETPDQLASADIEKLAAAAEAFLASPRGVRFAHASERYTSEQFRRWRRAAVGCSDLWLRSAAHAAWQRRRSEAPRLSAFTAHSDHADEADAREPRRATSKTDDSNRRRRRETTRKERPAPPLRFFLELESPVVDAPAIGEKTAGILAEAGIRTVADLLACDPASTASELSDHRLTAARLRTWQQQARLACRIPELRGYGAQLLVACGLTEPAQVASADSAELAEKIAELCRTKQGRRILRNSPAPTPRKIARWVECAGHGRTLDAA